MTDKKREYFSVFAWVGKNKQKTKIGYAFKTDRGTIRIKADNMLDATKLGRALLSGIEIEKRSGKSQTQGEAEPEYQSAADEYERPA